jgi:hypothetical protein
MDLYCSMFVDFSGDTKGILEKISKAIPGSEIENSSIDTDKIALSVRRNDEFDNKGVDFLFFKYIVEIDPTDESTLETQVDFISKMLTNFWDDEIKAVAACDFEDMLPNNGGYFEEKVYQP